MRRSSNNGRRSSSGGGGGGNTLATTEEEQSMTITNDTDDDPTLHAYLLNSNRAKDEEIEFYSDLLGLSTNSNRNNQNQNRRNSNNSNINRRNSNNSNTNRRNSNNSNNGASRNSNNNGSNPLLIREQNPIPRNSINFNTSHSALSDGVRSDLDENESDIEYEYEDDVQDDDTDAHSGIDDGTVNKKKILIKEIKLQFKKERKIVTFWRRMLFITVRFEFCF